MVFFTVNSNGRLVMNDHSTLLNEYGIGYDKHFYVLEKGFPLEESEWIPFDWSDSIDLGLYAGEGPAVIKCAGVVTPFDAELETPMFKIDI